MKIIYLVTEYTQWKSEHHSFVSGTAVYTNRKNAARHDKLMTYETALKDCYWNTRSCRRVLLNGLHLHI